MRPDPGARSYTLNGFLSEYAPSFSGSYSIPKPYLGSDVFRGSSYLDKIKSVYSSVLTGMKDSYKSIKDKGFFSSDYELCPVYK